MSNTINKKLRGRPTTNIRLFEYSNCGIRLLITGTKENVCHWTKNKRKRNRSSVCNKCIISQFYSDRNSLIIVNGSVMLHLCKNRTETMAGQAAIRCISSFLRQVGRNPFHERCDSGVDTRIRILGTADSPADDTHLRPFTVSRFLVNQRTTAVALYTGYIQINCKYFIAYVWWSVFTWHESLPG